MTNEGSYVALGLKVWKAQLDRADKLFGGLSSEEALRKIAPGRNRLLYLWGHLTAMHDAMLPLLALGDRFHPEFDVAFVSNPDKSQAAIPAAHGRIGRRFRERCLVQSLRHTAVPHQPYVLSPRPGGARTQVIERKASTLVPDKRACRRLFASRCRQTADYSENGAEKSS